MIITARHIIIISGITAVIALILAVISIIARYKPKDSIMPDKDGSYQIDLKTLSELWKSKKKDKIKPDKTEPIEIKIEELAQLWKEEKVYDSNFSQRPEFVNPLIADFYTSHIAGKPYFKKQQDQHSICIDLLGILDREGNCPSVVDKNKIPADFEARWDDNTYSILKRVSLTEHTLNVCRNIIETLTKDNSKSIIPNAVIAGLGHDIGKIESLQGEHYSLGDHPLTAGVLLLKIKGFGGLPKKDDILTAVKLHHKQPAGLIGKVLKEADMKARQAELEDTAQRAVLNESSKISQPAAVKADSVAQSVEHEQRETIPPQSKPTSKLEPEPIAKPESTGWQAQKDIYDIGSQSALETKKEPVKRADISAWFDPDGFIEEMKPYINKLFGTRFMAVSMSEGYVYFQSKVLEEIARRQAKTAGDLVIPAIPAGDDNMRPALLSIADHFRTEGKIARELIKDNYFGGYFSVLLNSGKVMKGYYTPFHAEAFGKIGDIEAVKPPRLKNIKAIEVLNE